MTDRWGLAVLGVLAAALPFELKTPLFFVGPLAITNTELAIYLVIVVWGIALLKPTRGPRAMPTWTPVHSAVVAWVGAIALSAALTTDDRTLAVKFALRSVCGALVFFAAADFVSTARRAGVLVCVLVAATAISALAGVAEIWLPGAAAPLMAFKTHPSRIGGFVRASGTFQYANNAVMYWEAVVPLILAAGLWITRHQGRQVWRWIGFGVSIVLVQAIVLSLSRAGLFVTTCTFLALVMFGRGSLRDLRAPAVAGLVALGVLALLNPRISGLVTLRLNTGDELTWYRAEYASTPSALTIDAGGSTRVSVTVRNTGRVMWPAKGDGHVRLSYHWQRATSDEAVILDGVRSPLPADVPPGGQVVVAASVMAPREPGAYVLLWDLVQENVMWFSIRGAGTGRLPVEVTSPTRPLPIVPAPRWVRIDPEARPPRRHLWRAGVAMWLERPMVGIGPDNFRHRYGPYLGLSPFDDRVHANNLYVETLANLGLVGIAALAWLIGALMSMAWRARGWLRDPASDADLLIVFGLLAAMGTFFLHGLVDYFLEFTPTLGLFWLLTGMLVGLLGRRRQPDPARASQGLCP